MGKKKEMKRSSEKISCTLPFGTYNGEFMLLKKGEKRNIRDMKSCKNAFIPIKVNDESVYVAEPDGKLIPNMINQQKCDFLIYCQNRPQTCFIELKGENISAKKEYNPYDQIIDTIKFLKNEKGLNNLVSGDVEKHAFIVSPGRQKIPRGVETDERQLWKNLVHPQKKSRTPWDLVHYVKVTKSGRYSNKKQIICSPGSPIQIPFNNQEGK